MFTMATTITVSILAALAPCRAWVASSRTALRTSLDRQKIDGLIMTVVTNSEGHCDRVAFIGEDNELRTTPNHLHALNLTADECSFIIKANEERSFREQGASVEGEKYFFIRRIGQMALLKKLGKGSVTVRETRMGGVLVAHTPMGRSWGKCNVGLHAAALYLEANDFQFLQKTAAPVPRAAALAPGGSMGTNVTIAAGHGVLHLGHGSGLPPVIDPTDSIFPTTDPHAAITSIFGKLGVGQGGNVVTFAEAPFTKDTDRRVLIKELFALNSTGVYFGTDAGFAMMMSATRTGVVVNAGEDKTYVVPVYEGHAIQHATTQTKGFADIGSRVVATIAQCDPGLWEALFTNIVLIGPGSTDGNAAANVEAAITKEAPGETIHVTVPPSSETVACTGASNFAFNPLFHESVIAPWEYEHYGPVIVQLKTVQ